MHGKRSSAEKFFLTSRTRSQRNWGATHHPTLQLRPRRAEEHCFATGICGTKYKKKWAGDAVRREPKKGGSGEKLYFSRRIKAPRRKQRKLFCDNWTRDSWGVGFFHSF